MKTRKNVVESLRQAKRDLLTIPEPAMTSSAVAYAGLPIDPTEFSSQLSSLQGSLKRANQPIVTQTPATAHVPANIAKKEKVVA